MKIGHRALVALLGGNDGGVHAQRAAGRSTSSVMRSSPRGTTFAPGCFASHPAYVDESRRASSFSRAASAALLAAWSATPST